MNDSTTWPASVDRAILSDLSIHGPDYPALVASRCGLHLGTVRSRCTRLAADGYLERASEEALYRVTSTGERYANGAGGPKDGDSG